MLECRALSLTYGEIRALDDLDLTVADGSITALIGPSGCGKSSLLRVVAGLERPDEGSVRWDGQRIDDVPTHRRGFGLMFQDFALFPHRSVGENVAFGLRMKGMDPAALAARVDEVLGFVGLEGYRSRGVTELSGGEQQRVALARTLAPDPRMIMLDEPLGSLDRALSDRLVVEMRDLFRRLAVTVLYVTHDQDEAFVVADDLAVMRAGSIVAAGTAEGVWRDPGTEWVARFLGHENILRPDSAATRLVLGDGFIAGSDATTGYAVPATALDVRPDAEGAGMVDGVTFGAGLHRIEITVGGERLVASSPRSIPLGSRVAVSAERSAAIPLSG